MNYQTYEITGKHKNTNRKKVVTINAKTEDLAKQKALEEFDLILPLQIVLIPHRKPTESQLNYARNLKIEIPCGATLEDVSCLISKCIDHDKDPNPGLIEFADGQNLLFSNYIGKKVLYDLIYEHLTGLDKTAFFIFSIYRWLSEDRQANLDTHPEKETFYLFAEQVKSDEPFQKSMQRYGGSDLRFFNEIHFSNGGVITGGSDKTLAYKKASAFLKDLYGVKLTKTKTFEDKPTNKSLPKNIGCLMPLLGMASIIILIYFLFTIY